MELRRLEGEEGCEMNGVRAIYGVGIQPGWVSQANHPGAEKVSASRSVPHFAGPG